MQQQTSITTIDSARRYPGLPAPGPLQRPIFFNKEQETNSSPIKKTLMRRRLVRRTTLKRGRH
jgi:hypothetical protein